MRTKIPVTNPKVGDRVWTDYAQEMQYGNAGTIVHINGNKMGIAWDNGWHKGMHLAGTDATAAFAGSPHSQSILNSFPIVGILEV